MSNEPKNTREESDGDRIEVLYGSVKAVLDQARNTVYRTAKWEMVAAYREIGRMIVEEEQSGSDRAAYGEQLIERLSRKLKEEYGKGFDRSNLWNMRKFYELFPKLDALRRELSWTHYRILLRVEKEGSREFYMQEAAEGNWSTRTLERQIGTHYHERMLASSKEGRPKVREEAEDKKEVMKGEDVIKDPYYLEFLGLEANEHFYESDLEQAIIDQLQGFLRELGRGFAFVDRQYRFTTESDDHYYIDLVFYNYILKCFFLIDLKTGKLSHQDIGQMDMYVRYFEDKVRQESDAPTIGLVLCAEKDRTVVKYSPISEGRQLFASKYRTYLPTEEELREEVEREREQVEREKRLRDEESDDEKDGEGPSGGR